MQKIKPNKNHRSTLTGFAIFWIFHEISKEPCTYNSQIRAVARTLIGGVYSYIRVLPV